MCAPCVILYNLVMAEDNKFGGGPVGLQTLSAAAMEEEDTILDIYEPYLMQMGFLERTPKGRIASRLAYKHLGVEHLMRQRQLM